jgi:hypothetical protein
MIKIINWFKDNRDSIIRNTFLLPILLVVIMSISHVVSWYDLGNPISWAIYLSVAIEIFALASVAAASIHINKGSIWFLFGLVTFIQIIGNVFYEYKEIDILGGAFGSWVELIPPVFSDWDAIDHRRLLALIQGGTLPLMSLTALHFFISFNEKKIIEKKLTTEPIKPKTEEFIEESPANMGIDAVAEIEKILQEELKTHSHVNQPIDEETFLVDDAEKTETIDMLSTEDEKLTDTLEELNNLTQSREIKTKTDLSKEDNNFGPPHINNGNI